MIRKHLSSILLGTALLIISILSLFIGVMEIDWKALFSGGNGMELNIFLLARIPRLLAVLCTGVGMGVAGLIMQQLCMKLSAVYADLEAIAPVVYLAVDYEKGVVESTRHNAQTIASIFRKEAERNGW